MNEQNNQSPTGSMLEPTEGLTTGQQLEYYRSLFKEQQTQSDQGESVRDENFVPRQAVDQEISNDSQYATWLAPVATNTVTPSTLPTDRSSKAYKHFQDKFENDPAIQEALPGLYALANEGLAQKGQGVDEQSIMLQIADALHQHMTPILDKHHGATREERSSKKNKYKLPDEVTNGGAF